ncbi:hypothetical protein [Rhodococcus sp. WB9]|uniref:hypothetical protein n=1 Tax=Rhodococcus sp. WB9 TaxID=2594007 RepID=UPI0021B46D76|nr:hypothetical protein [Rhodococcus sp. WB9]
MNLEQKASAVCVNGEWRGIARAPTGDAMKASKRGRLGLHQSRGEYQTVPGESISPEANILQSRVVAPWSGGGLGLSCERTEARTTERKGSRPHRGRRRPNADPEIAQTVRTRCSGEASSLR